MGDVLHPNVRSWVVAEIAATAALPLPRTDDAARLEWIGIDDIAQHKLALAAEDCFGIEIGAAELEAAKTVGDVVALIERKRAAMAA